MLHLSHSPPLLYFIHIRQLYSTVGTILRRAALYCAGNSLWHNCHGTTEKFHHLRSLVWINCLELASSCPIAILYADEVGPYNWKKSFNSYINNIVIFIKYKSFIFNDRMPRLYFRSDGTYLFCLTTFPRFSQPRYFISIQPILHQYPIIHKFLNQIRINVLSCLPTNMNK